MPTVAIGFERIAAVTFDYILGAIVTAGVLLYLVYALLRAEQF